MFTPSSDAEKGVFLLIEAKEPKEEKINEKTVYV